MLISKLKGKSKKGKDRIRQHGDMWEVCEELDKVLFPTNSSGPFLKLRSVMCECKKGDFVRPIFAPRVFLCIEEKVIDLDTNEPYFWASDEDGGEFELVPEEIVEVISGDKMADCRWS